eukprot:CAMPEP_0174363674 /NCGR_PEP_ID=MMETSP0811_2-20130205/69811_1 /TAXON_ID=73025 ORGANISM="Eutreptiella gymnastica-like, Strain CCMP1594" /NCGR_SAMPLE_ID=MMETSP0811_2 /ASSEMBLY_ACC=CAM_ASM_000667 /LENGTH=135 /DNA_ID=CAMNT_0015502581 /DNA_START=1200 /DNA_END=1604 /DNA_ORIENTATION=-
MVCPPECDPFPQTLEWSSAAGCPRSAFTHSVGLGSADRRRLEGNRRRWEGHRRRLEGISGHVLLLTDVPVQDQACLQPRAIRVMGSVWGHRIPLGTRGKIPACKRRLVGAHNARLNPRILTWAVPEGWGTGLGTS